MTIKVCRYKRISLINIIVVIVTFALVLLSKYRIMLNSKQIIN